MPMITVENAHYLPIGLRVRFVDKAEYELRRGQYKELGKGLVEITHATGVIAGVQFEVDDVPPEMAANVKVAEKRA